MTTCGLPEREDMAPLRNNCPPVPETRRLRRAGVENVMTRRRTAFVTTPRQSPWHSASMLCSPPHGDGRRGWPQTHGDGVLKSQAPGMNGRHLPSQCSAFEPGPGARRPFCMPGMGPVWLGMGPYRLQNGAIRSALNPFRSRIVSRISNVHTHLWARIALSDLNRTSSGKKMALIGQRWAFLVLANALSSFWWPVSELGWPLSALYRTPDHCRASLNLDASAK